MELLQLTYFRDAAESENFSDTAKRFRVPPSAVSQSIKRLENELGTALFERRANRVKLNEQGAQFLARIDAALTLIEEAKAALAEAPHRIVLSIFINRRIVMQTVEKFSRLHPTVDIVTKYTSLSGDADLIVAEEGLCPEGYRSEVLLQEDIALALRRDHPLAGAENVTAEAMRGEPFISTNKDSSLYNITEAVCGDMGFAPRIVICSDDPHYIRKCVELGLGLALVPATSWRGEFSDSVVLKRICQRRRTTCVCRREGRPSPYADAFLELLRAECRAEEMAEEAY